jgi:hypothetical protein
MANPYQGGAYNAHRYWTYHKHSCGQNSQKQFGLYPKKEKKRGPAEKQAGPAEKCAGRGDCIPFF